MLPASFFVGGVLPDSLSSRLRFFEPALLGSTVSSSSVSSASELPSSDCEDCYSKKKLSWVENITYLKIILIKKYKPRCQQSSSVTVERLNHHLVDASWKYRFPVRPFHCHPLYRRQHCHHQDQSLSIAKMSMVIFDKKTNQRKHITYPCNETDSAILHHNSRIQSDCINWIFQFLPSCQVLPHSANRCCFHHHPDQNHIHRHRDPSVYGQYPVLLQRHQQPSMSIAKMAMVILSKISNRWKTYLFSESDSTILYCIYIIVLYMSNEIDRVLWQNCNHCFIRIQPK